MNGMQISVPSAPVAYGLSHVSHLSLDCCYKRSFILQILCMVLCCKVEGETDYYL